jgi:hypothetical protein
VGSKDIYKLKYMETNTPVKLTFIETELKKFETEHEITETSLIALAAKYRDLKVNGVDDKEGLKSVESARKELKNQRVKIEKASKGMRDSATKFQKAVIAREKDFVAIIEPEENRLEGIEDAIWQEKERLREEAEKKESDRIQNMLDQLAAVNYAIDFHILKGMTDEQFQEILQDAKRDYEENARLMAIELEKEKERVRLQEEAKRIEEAEIARVRAEQEKERKALEEERITFLAEKQRVEEDSRAVAAERKAIQDAKDAEEREKQRQVELEEARQEAVRKARIEADEKAERENREAIAAAKEKKELEEEKLLAGADKGKFEKLQYLLETNFLDEEVIIWLHFKSKKGKAAAARVKDLLKQANQICKDNV